MTDDEVNEVLTAVAATCETLAIGARAIQSAGERACASP
jgi:hypothetical protein